ncbi:hypothetical protein PHMEG_00022578 [Phytophthora megakarya]|uniref:Uncharacterized protein n=1 Tax=Phytophthora megakarya TaxID=4795 RepID=A0A225VK07_9STRA|nr:hypothetical protein PHMEG_00022578 [Phytophthora megakarya]
MYKCLANHQVNSVSLAYFFFYRTNITGLDELQPGNTLRAKATAIAAFAKFLKEEDVEEEM